MMLSHRRTFSQHNGVTHDRIGYAARALLRARLGPRGDAQFLVIEYLEGETLADRLKQGPLPAETLLKLATEIADALESANIFITRRGRSG